MANRSDCQLAALQNIIRIQDGLLKSGGHEEDSSTVWRNEAYKLSVQNQILHDECVAIGKELIAAAASQRAEIRKEVMNGLQKEMNRVTSLVNQRMEKVEKQIKRVQVKLGKAHAIQIDLDRCHQDIVVNERKTCPVELMDVLNDLKSLEREARDLLIRE